MTITPEQLDALEKLEKAATPGPWEVDHAISFKDGAEYARTLAIYHLPTEHHIIEVIESPDEHKGECIHNLDDAALIVAIRNAAPDLIAEVRRLRAELTQAWNERIDLSNELHHERTDHVRFTAHILAEKQKAEARVGELEAEVRRLTASLAEMRECYIARTADRDRAEARVAELEAKLNHESYVSNKRALRIEHNQLCAGVGSRCAHLFSERYDENGKLTGTCIYCGVPGLGPAT